MKAVRVLILPVLFFGVIMSAQTGVNVSGSVEDPSGAVIPSAQLTLMNKATGLALAARSDGEGSFVFANVSSGEYVLRSEAEGFKRLEMPVPVQTQPMTNVRVTMPISTTEEVVDVSASGSRPDSPENNSDSVYVNTDFIAGLPSQSQDILPVVSNFLSPAAQGVEGMSIVVDGVGSNNVNEPTDPTTRIYVNKDPYSAEFRRPGSGRLEVVTRNGSRSYFDGTFD